MRKIQVKIRSMGTYIPKRKVPAAELDLKLKLATGTLERISGVKVRHYANEHETNSQMGAYACMAALEKACLKYEDIDAIICASGTSEQPIPCTAVLIQKALNKEESGTPCFDINSTCLGFIIGLDVVSSLLESHRFKRVLLVSSEIASVGLPWHQHEACALFGDGAVAAVVERTPEGESSHVIASHQETYSSGSQTCEILGGGTRLHGRNFRAGLEEDKRFLFSMDGRKVFKQASQRLPGFLKNLQSKSNLNLQEYKMVVPHQASGTAMGLMRKKMEVSEENWMNIIADYGNMIAASIPLALSIAIEQGKVKRGDKVLLIGTSAGFSIGAVAFEY